jgi:L-aspartate oxidase
MRHLGGDFLRRRFPTIYNACAAMGVLPEKDLVPVVPAAHYMCGGVVVDAWGRTDLPGLYAVGETTFTGLHGANRLASNSLLEALVFADRAVADMERRGLLPLPREVASWSEEGTKASFETVLLDHDWDAVRRLLWDYVGIVRSDERLALASRHLEVLRQAVEGYYWRYRLTSDLVELRNLVLVGDLIVRCARFRRESRGLHFLLDCPEPSEALLGDTLLSRFQEPHLHPTTEPLVTSGRDAT